MIPFIRSISELMSLSESRDWKHNTHKEKKLDYLPEDSAQRKRFIRSVNTEKVKLPSLPKSLRHKWIHKKEYISSLLDELDYNNQIQSSYDLTLQYRQTNNNDKEVA